MPCLRGMQSALRLPSARDAQVFFKIYGASRRVAEPGGFGPVRDHQKRLSGSHEPRISIMEAFHPWEEIIVYRKNGSWANHRVRAVYQSFFFARMHRIKICLSLVGASSRSMLVPLYSTVQFSSVQATNTVCSSSRPAAWVTTAAVVHGAPAGCGCGYGYTVQCDEDMKWWMCAFARVRRHDATPHLTQQQSNVLVPYSGFRHRNALSLFGETLTMLLRACHETGKTTPRFSLKYSVIHFTWSLPNKHCPNSETR